MNRKTFLQSISAAIVGFFGAKEVAEEVLTEDKANLYAPKFATIKGEDLVVAFKRHEKWETETLFDHDPKMTYKHVEGLNTSRK